MHPWRVGCVSFLNTKPLIAGLEGDPRFDLRFAVPSELAGMLLDGRVDLALCPVFDFFAHPGLLETVPAGGIACDGETLTVKLFSRVPLAGVRSVAVDPDSHTSVNLLRVLLLKKFGLAPEMKSIAEAGGTDAILLIGDKVIARAPDSAEFPWSLDLGAAWKDSTGLPFVFAVWMKRRGTELGELPAVLSARRGLNASRIQAIADLYAPGLGWPPHTRDLARQYLAHILRFDLGPREERAMAQFGRDLAQFHLAPPT